MKLTPPMTETLPPIRIPTYRVVCNSLTAAPSANSVGLVWCRLYTTRTPPGTSGPPLLGVASRAIWLIYAHVAPSGYTLQRLSSDCGSEGLGFEPRRSPYELH